MHLTSLPSNKSTYSVIALALFALTSCWTDSSLPSLRPIEKEISGLRIEFLTESSSLYLAGLRADDILLNWARRSSNSPIETDLAGNFASPFSWEWLRIEQVPRRNILLTVQRAGKIETLPIYPQWKSWIEPEVAVLSIQRPQNTNHNKAWSLFKDALLSEKSGRNSAAATLYWKATEFSSHPPEKIIILHNLSKILMELRRTEEAVESAEKMRYLCQRYHPQSLWHSTSLHLLGTLNLQQGNLSQAEEYMKAALQIRQETLPESPWVANTLSNMGLLYRVKGQLDDADRHLTEAAAIYSRFEQLDFEYSQALSTLGTIAAQKIDPWRAKRLLETAVESLPNPTSTKQILTKARILNDLGLVCGMVGETEASLTYHQQALSLRRGVDAKSIEAALSTGNIAHILHKLGRLSDAADLQQDALEILSSSDPKSRHTGTAQLRMGTILAAAGDYSLASEHYQSAASIWSSHEPCSTEVVVAQQGLSFLSRERGDLDAAALHLETAITLIQCRLKKISLSTLTRGRWKGEAADAYRNLIFLYADSGRIAEAYEILKLYRERSYRINHGRTTFDIPREEYQQDLEQISRLSKNLQVRPANSQPSPIHRDGSIRNTAQKLTKPNCTLLSHIERSETDEIATVH